MPFFLAGSRAVTEKRPCQQTMVNRVSLSRLVRSSDSANVTKAVWTFFADLRQSANRESFCRDITAIVRVRPLAGNQSVHVISQPARFGWTEMNLSALFHSWPSSHPVWESLEIETSLTCKHCTVTAANQLPYLKLVDLGQMGQALRLQYQKSQPLLALHVYDPAVANLLTQGTAPGVQTVQRTRRLAWFMERLRPCHRQEYKVSVTQFQKYRNVVHPKVADIGKCGGSCSFDVITTSEMAGRVSEHAVLTAYYHLRNRQAPKALCVPIKYKPYHFIVMENGVFKYMLPDSLSVSECGCS